MGRIAEEIMRFLNDAEQNYYAFEDDGNPCQIVRIPYNAETDLLYFNRWQLALGKDLDYCGFYSRITKKLYDAHTRFTAWGFDNSSSRGELQRSLREAIKTRLRDKYNDAPDIEDDTELANDYKRDNENFLEYRADREAQEYFYRGYGSPEEADELCFDISSRMPDDELIEYVNRPETEIARQTALCEREQSDYIKLQLWRRGVVRKKLQALIDDVRGRHYYIRAIQNAIGSEKSYNITISKHGVPFTFKYPADALRQGCRYESGIFTSSRMANDDASAFCTAFHPECSFVAEEIMLIAHGRRILYAKEAPSAE